MRSSASSLVRGSVMILLLHQMLTQSSYNVLPFKFSQCAGAAIIEDVDSSGVDPWLLGLIRQNERALLEWLAQDWERTGPKHTDPAEAAEHREKHFV